MHIDFFNRIKLTHTPMRIPTDQPGRFIAVFVFSPLLIYKAIEYNDHFIGLFAVCLWTWDSYWILYRAPVHATEYNQI